MGVKVNCCIHQEGFHVDLLEYPESLLRKWSGKKLFCPICKASVIYRRGIKRAAHFAHVSACTYPYYEQETEEHMKAKRLVKEWLQSRFPHNITLMEAYVKEAQQRADVETIFPDGHRLCIEIQCSTLSEEIWKKRYTGYKKANVSQLWLIGSTMFNNIYSGLKKIRLTQFLQALCQEQNGKLFIISPNTAELIYLSGITPYQSYKTIYIYKNIWKGLIIKTKIWKSGVIDTSIAEYIFAQKKQIGEQFRKRREQYNFQLVEWMKPWGDPTIHRHHKEQYRQNITEHPVKKLLESFYDIDRENISVLFDQVIQGDQVFKIDHRLWQAYLFFTEIHRIYERSSKYDNGLKKPTLFIRSILHGTERVPRRPFGKMIEPYLNRSLLQAKKTDPITFGSILTDYEIIYEYFSRLTMLGFLRNITPQKENISSKGKLFGRFEVLYDRFHPERFHTEEGVQTFFQNHMLQYRRHFWYDVKSSKTIE